MKARTSYGAVVAFGLSGVTFAVLGFVPLAIICWTVAVAVFAVATGTWRR